MKHIFGINCLNKNEKTHLMLILPPINTKERAKIDLTDLKIIFYRCRTLGLLKNPRIKKYFTVLKNHIGSEKFLMGLMHLNKFIELRKNEMKKVESCLFLSYISMYCGRNVEMRE